MRTFLIVTALLLVFLSVKNGGLFVGVITFGLLAAFIFLLVRAVLRLLF